MELILTFDKWSEFEYTKKEADKANALFPNTVQNLILQPSVNEWLRPDWMTQAKQTLQQTRNVRAVYKVGITLLITKCTGRVTSSLSNFNQLVYPFLPNVNIIYFSAPVSYEQMKLGPARVHSQIITRFENCKKKIDAIMGSRRKVEVGFITRWSDTGHTGDQDFVQMVQYWRMMNQWAQSSKTTVIFMEAFDNARWREHGRSGWWKLKSGRYQTAAEYVFEDKQARELNS